MRGSIAGLARGTVIGCRSLRLIICNGICRRGSQPPAKLDVHLPPLRQLAVSCVPTYRDAFIARRRGLTRCSTATVSVEPVWERLEQGSAGGGLSNRNVEVQG